MAESLGPWAIAVLVCGLGMYVVCVLVWAMVRGVLSALADAPEKAEQERAKRRASENRPSDGESG